MLRPVIVSTLILTSLGGSPILGQVQPFPGWAQSLFISLTEAEQVAQTSEVWASVDQLFCFRIKYRTPIVRVGPYEFRAQTNDGVIAVWQRIGNSILEYGGLRTAFTDILGISIVRAGPATPWHQTCLAIVGKRQDGTFAVQAMLFDPVVPPEESQLVLLPVVSPPGEVWIAAGIVDDKVYVLDGVSATVFRYIDTNADLVADARDPAFSVTIPVGRRVAVFGFVSDPVLVVRSVTKWRDAWRYNAPRFGIKEPSSGTFVYVEERSVPAAHNPFLKLPPVAGSTTVAVGGQGANAVQLEASASPSGPWVAVSSAVEIVSSFQYEIICLNSGNPLQLGQYLRVFDVSSGAVSAAAQIGSKAPVVYTVRPTNEWGEIPQNADFEIVGDNLDLAGTAQVIETKTNQVFALAIVSQTKTKIVAKSPSIVGRCALVVSEPLPGAEQAVIWMTIR